MTGRPATSLIEDSVSPPPVRVSESFQKLAPVHGAQGRRRRRWCRARPRGRTSRGGVAGAEDRGGLGEGLVPPQRAALRARRGRRSGCRGRSRRHRRRPRPGRARMGDSACAVQIGSPVAASSACAWRKPVVTKTRPAGIGDAAAEAFLGVVAGATGTGRRRSRRRDFRPPGCAPSRGRRSRDRNARTVAAASRT